MKQAMRLLVSSETDEWYTPPGILAAVHDVLGGIELDPASCTVANRIVKAERFYTIKDNGLTKSWRARSLFMNSPYGRTAARSTQAVFMDYLISQLPVIGSCIALTKTVPGYKWWDDLFRGKWPGPVCITEGRISFIAADGQRRGKSKAASSLWYWGPSEGKFAERFDSIGRVLDREGSHGRL